MTSSKNCSPEMYIVWTLGNSTDTADRIDIQGIWRQEPISNWDIKILIAQIVILVIVKSITYLDIVPLNKASRQQFLSLLYGSRHQRHVNGMQDIDKIYPGEHFREDHFFYVHLLDLRNECAKLSASAHCSARGSTVHNWKFLFVSKLYTTFFRKNGMISKNQ